MIIPLIYRSYRKTIYIAFIINADCPNRFFFDGHLSTSKLWKWPVIRKHPYLKATVFLFHYIFVIKFFHNHVQKSKSRKLENNRCNGKFFNISFLKLICCIVDLEFYIMHLLQASKIMLFKYTSKLGLENIVWQT